LTSYEKTNKRRSNYAEYELRKAEIVRQGLSAFEYQKAIAKLVKELRL